MEVGDSASDFELEANDGTKISLKSFAGKNNVVLCFYPKNHLFACPSKKVFEMAKSVISVYDEILSTDSKLFAISIDTVESQKSLLRSIAFRTCILAILRKTHVRNIQVLTLQGWQSVQLSS
uniref:Peroxiredoxin n=1 Tax=uncultured marine thaumarchaeote AD1000_50_E11 TaxID=1455923 RepID=A0A075FYX2_9ARCH|nr:Peroxiredoxin [uncultured marine thaumarchaeote AD1000_50_E11]